MTVHSPQTLAQVDGDWISRVLAPDGGARAESIDVVGVVWGSNCKARIAVSWDSEGIARGLPDAVVVKGNFTESLGEDHVEQKWHELHQMLNACEARFYREFAPELKVRTPRSFFAETDASSGDSIVILEDLVRAGCTFSTFDHPLDADMMAKALEQLAILHASTWNQQRLIDGDLRDGFAEGGMLDAFLSERNWDQQMARARGAVVPGPLRDRTRVDRAIRTLWTTKRSGPVCLVHGDPHVGNIYFTADGDPGFLDWPLSTLGSWAWDVGYCMASSMTIEDRRAHEVELVRGYLDGVAAMGAPAPTFDEAWLQYRRFSIWGFLALLTPGDGIQSEEYNTVVGERHAVAAVDLDALGALGID